MSFDIIGDIHGHGDHLTALLSKLGYRETKGAWRHSERQALFVGDFIDRGPKQVETVMTVRRMVDAGSAQAIMGNHEFNAIAWFLPDPNKPGEFLRPHHSPEHGLKNRHQHAAFLAEVYDKPDLHKEIIDWFLTLPLWLDDLPDLRLAHACWHPKFMEYLKTRLREGNRLSPELMIQATQEPKDKTEIDNSTPSVFKAIEAITKGLEVPLPEGHSFLDKDNHLRHRVRVRWWDPEAHTFQTSAMLAPEEREKLPALPVPEHGRIPYLDEKPLFIGHYWFSGQPTPIMGNLACVDYSVAKGGKLCAYRWDGEASLQESSFHFV
jgi:hypothetical protein